MKKWREWAIESIKYTDLKYPKNLLDIKGYPKKIYFRGNWDKNIFKSVVSIVGSRRMTHYGQMVVEKIMPKLVNNKVCVVSGFMYGVDTCAHKLCLELGGRTIAVLACGLDYLIPTENDNLYSQILDNGGLVISEYESDFKATLWSFPQRNRIVSGLSTVGVIIVEATKNSGSLVTANFAMEQNKKLWAVPGPITAVTSEGCNELIKTNKAQMLLTADDLWSNQSGAIIEQLDIFMDLDKNETIVVRLLEAESLSVDDICRKCKIQIRDLSPILSRLEIKGYIEEINGMYYKKQN